MLVPLDWVGGGGVSDVVDVVPLGVPEPGPVSLLPGTGLGGVVSLEGPGTLGVLAGDSLVGGGVLVSLGSGGGSFPKPPAAFRWVALTIHHRCGRARPIPATGQDSKAVPHWMVPLCSAARSGTDWERVRDRDWL